VPIPPSLTRTWRWLRSSRSSRSLHPPAPDAHLRSSVTAVDYRASVVSPSDVVKARVYEANRALSVTAGPGHGVVIWVTSVSRSRALPGDAEVKRRGSDLQPGSGSLEGVADPAPTGGFALAARRSCGTTSLSACRQESDGRLADPTRSPRSSWTFANVRSGWRAPGSCQGFRRLLAAGDSAERSCTRRRAARAKPPGRCDPRPLQEPEPGLQSETRR